MSDVAPTTNAPTMALRAQYVKDLSFENPRAPKGLFTPNQPPALEVNLNLRANAIEGPLHELEIHIAVTATQESDVLFKCELVYAGVVELRNLSNADAERALFIAGANLLFPFARRVVADATRDGGFPPVQLEPIDFAALYAHRQQAEQAPATGSH
jgi:preprotein translocase subunit SecB